jgi:hypothetical protein
MLCNIMPGLHNPFTTPRGCFLSCLFLEYISHCQYQSFHLRVIHQRIHFLQSYREDSISPTQPAHNHRNYETILQYCHNVQLTSLQQIHPHTPKRQTPSPSNSNLNPLPRNPRPQSQQPHAKRSTLKTSLFPTPSHTHLTPKISSSCGRCSTLLHQSSHIKCLFLSRVARLSKDATEARRWDTGMEMEGLGGVWCCGCVGAEFEAVAWWCFWCFGKFGGWGGG